MANYALCAIFKLLKKSPSPSANVDAKKKYVLIDDVNNGFSLYNISTGGLVQRFPQKGVLIHRIVPKESMFAEKDQVVVGGSNHGKMYVWNRYSGKTLQEMNHPDGGLVQAVTVCAILPINHYLSQQ